MKEALVWGKINKILELQKNMDKYLMEQKYIVTDLILKVRFLESKLNIKDGEYEDYKKEFVTKLEEYRKNFKSGEVRPEESGANEGACELSGCPLPGNESN